MKKRTIDDVIRRALDRELTKMQDDQIYGGERPAKINDWDGEALASWVAPGVIRAVKEHIKGA
jgi:hypothetical protein